MPSTSRPPEPGPGRASPRGYVHPTFVNVGPGRSGTSWLLEMLASHPEIVMSSVKETEFFNLNFELGTDWYLSHFRKMGTAVGEISNMYYLDPAVPGRLHDFDPSMQIIFNIRDPESLLRSMIAFAGRRGLDTSDPAILNEPIGRIMGSGFESRLARGAATAGDMVLLRDAVLLSRYVRPYLERFGPDRVYFLVYDRIAREPAALLSEVYGFLGVDPTLRPPEPERVINSAIEPRIRWIGVMAPRASYMLRRMGAYGLLGRLHRSRTIKKVFYREPTARGPALVIPEDLRRTLGEERRRLLEMVPGLDRIWLAEALN